MREIRQSGSEGGGTVTPFSLPLCGSRGLNGAERNDTPGKRVNGVACRRYARRRRYPEKDPFCHPLNVENAGRFWFFQPTLR